MSASAPKDALTADCLACGITAAQSLSDATAWRDYTPAAHEVHTGV